MAYWSVPLAASCRCLYLTPKNCFHSIITERIDYRLWIDYRWSFLFHCNHYHSYWPITANISLYHYAQLSRACSGREEVKVIANNRRIVDEDTSSLIVHKLLCANINVLFTRILVLLCNHYYRLSFLFHCSIWRPKKVQFPWLQHLAKMIFQKLLCFPHPCPLKCCKVHLDKEFWAIWNFKIVVVFW